MPNLATIHRAIHRSLNRAATRMAIGRWNGKSDPHSKKVIPLTVGDGYVIPLTVGEDIRHLDEVSAYEAKERARKDRKNAAARAKRAAKRNAEGEI